MARKPKSEIVAGDEVSLSGTVTMVYDGERGVTFVVSVRGAVATKVRP